MELHISIPVVIIPENALDTQQRESLLSGDMPYDAFEEVFAERSLEKAAELMRQEMKLGIAEPVSLTAKPPTLSKRETIRRLSPR
jgi:hypothetical protein